MKKLTRIVEFILTLFFLFMFICTLLQVFCRYLPYSFTWTGEISRFLLIWCTFIGVAIAIREKTHITITFLLDKLPDYLKLKVQILINLFLLFFSYFLFRGSLVAIALNWRNVGGNLVWLKEGYIYLILPLSIPLMMFYLGKQIVENFIELKKMRKLR